MELIVGVMEGGIALRKLMDNRLPAGCGIVLAEGDRQGRVRVQLEGRRALFELTDALADIIMENLQIRYIMQRMDRQGLEEKEKCDILIKTLKRLWYADSGREWLEQQKKDVSNRLAVCVLENGAETIFLDGVINFRMKDFTERWRGALAACVEEHLSESERREFVRLLRYFVSMREPALGCVYLRAEENEYILTAEEGAAIDLYIPGREITQEDMLLSRLISLSPEHIVICEPERFEDAQLIELLRQVFVGRVVIENN